LPQGLFSGSQPPTTPDAAPEVATAIAGPEANPFYPFPPPVQQVVAVPETGDHFPAFPPPIVRAPPPPPPPTDHFPAFPAPIRGPAPLAPPPPPPPPAVPAGIGKALLRGIRPGPLICRMHGIAIHQGTRLSDGAHLALVTLEDRGAIAAERRQRILDYGERLGLTVEANHDEFLLAKPVPSGTGTDLLALGWRLAKRIDAFREICRRVRQLHLDGVAMGPIPPESVLFDGDLNPFLVGPQLVSVEDAAIYSAPETSEFGILGPQSDVFSLGRLLHFFVLRRDPHVEDADLPRLDELMDYPAGLSRIIRQATSRDPSRRYRSIEALLVHLDRFGDYEKVGLAHPTVEERNFGGLSVPPVAIERAEGPDRSVDPTETHRSPLRTTRRQLFELGRTSRWLGLGVGALLAIGGGIFAFLFGEATLSMVMFAAGTGALGFCIVPPKAELEARARPAFAALSLSLALFYGPLPFIAGLGAGQRLDSRSPEIRAQTFRKELDQGRTAFLHVDLSDCNLAGTTFLLTQMQGGRLDNATLTDAVFHTANVDGVRFDGAQLGGAVFLETKLDGARGLERARCDEFTRFPDPWKCKDGRPTRTGMTTEEGKPAPKGTEPPAAAPSEDPQGDPEPDQ
ncbi:MAG: pentapeptide repeat-containing protein, partial [Myxococcales bacterium]|nr:pentapeptide repeat-containing protein [Myxococcales bacterium]